MADPIKVTKGGSIVPEWGNADRPKDEKITVEYRFLTFAEQQEMLDPADLGKSFKYESKLLARMITSITNLSVDDGKVRQIKTGDDLVAEPGLDGLAMELWLKLRKMSAIDKKK
jgi:hypothetical protein